jgi:hypothetical protein
MALRLPIDIATRVSPELSAAVDALFPPAPLNRNTRRVLKYLF